MKNKIQKNKKFKHETIDIGYEDLDCVTAKSGRTYSTPDGVQYPSITTVLSILSEDAIRAWRERVGEEQAEIVSGKLLGVALKYMQS